MLMVTWTDERKDIARSMYEEGKSFSIIADRFGDVTRNAVAGVLKRMGLLGSRKPPAVRESRPRVVVARFNNAVVFREPYRKPPRTPRVFLIEEDEQPNTGIGIMQLTRVTCRWPVGDPRDESFSYCGHRIKHGKVYCAKHCEEAYNPLKR
jgi:GcrA cell cycle regulator